MIFKGSTAHAFSFSTSIRENSSEGRYSAEGGLSSEDGRATSTSDAPTPSTNLTPAPAFGEGNSLLTQAPAKDTNKKKKPKNNMTKSNSSFISRVIVNESLSRRLTDRPNDGIFAFANINRAFQWLDLSSKTKQDYLTKILFTKAHCLCHDVNRITKSSSHIDTILGFSTGEIIWWEPISQRYTRLNKNVRSKTPSLPQSFDTHIVERASSTALLYPKSDGFQDLKACFSPLIWTGR